MTGALARRLRTRIATSVATLVTLLGLCTLPLEATTFVGVADERLVDQAELIASVEVLEVAPIDSRRALQTRVTARADELLKGWIGDSRLTIRVPGGRSRNGERVVWIPGAPVFTPGDRALLFLRRNHDGTWRILHLMLGAFHEERGAGEPLLVRATGGAREIAPPGRTSEPTPSRPAERHRDRFRSWIRDSVAGRDRPADYFVERPARQSSDLRAAFTLLSSESRFRWFEFDTGGEVKWVLHRKGQKGLKGKGVKVAKRALAAWNGSRTKTGVRFTFAGKTKSTTGFSELDGRNTILFHDQNDLVAEDFDCEQGGVLAVGGLSWAIESGKLWKGMPFLENVEGEVVVNDGVECLFEPYPSVALQVYTHELGHALGLGHSCGLRTTNRFPACRSSAVLNEAMMRAALHTAGRGDRLTADDIAATRFVYDPDFYAAPCHLPPGHKKFCKLCGPCGEGQGNCRSDNQCAKGLVCEQDVGADYGFAPKRDVCVAP